MNNTAFRVMLAAAIMAIVFGITLVMGKISGVTKPVTMPQTSITTLPRGIGERQGEDQEVDNRMFHAIQAAEVVSRKYTDPAGSAIDAHIASFSDYWRLTPHSPMVCYPANGFTKNEETIVELPGCDGARVKMVYFEKDKKPHIVVFWFQFGDKIFVDDEGLSVAQRAYRSSKTWPAIVKVLLSTAHPRPKQFEPEMLKFAGQIREWSRKLQTDPPLPAEEKDTAAETPAEEEAKDAEDRENATTSNETGQAKPNGETRLVTMPQTSITTMPRSIDGRACEDQEVSATVLRATQAAEVVSRSYPDSTGESIRAYVASFNTYWRSTPHSPMVTYPACGFEKIKESVVELPGCDGARATLAYFEKDKRPHIVVFWYQFGDKIFLNDEELSKAQRPYHASKTYPAIVEVLLDAPHPWPDQCRPKMLRFAGQVRRWSMALQKEPTLPPEANAALNRMPVNAGTRNTGPRKAAMPSDGENVVC